MGKRVLAEVCSKWRSRLIFTLLLLEEAHCRKHSGVAETVCQFRLSGYWTTQATKLAKSVKSKCVNCRMLDKKPEHQLMGSLLKDKLKDKRA